MILAEYRCRCTWVGEFSEKHDNCAKHGADLRREFEIGQSDKIEAGWQIRIIPDFVPGSNAPPVPAAGGRHETIFR